MRNADKLTGWSWSEIRPGRARGCQSSRVKLAWIIEAGGRGGSCGSRDPCHPQTDRQIAGDVCVSLLLKQWHPICTGNRAPDRRAETVWKTSGRFTHTDTLIQPTRWESTSVQTQHINTSVTLASVCICAKHQYTNWSFSARMCTGIRKFLYINQVHSAPFPQTFLRLYEFFKKLRLK